MSAPSGRKSASSRTLLCLLGQYSITNFILFGGSVVAWKKAKHQTEYQECELHGLACGFTAWGIYPFLAAAGLISGLVALVMFTHGVTRTANARLDPLYVFRGVFFTLLTLVPMEIIGWSSLSHLRNGLGEQSHNQSSLLNVADMRVDSGDGLLVGIGGAFTLSKLIHIAGTTFPIAMVHFNIILSAVICGLGVALAPPVGVLVGVHAVVPTDA
ncbi:uncharacterized protein MAM_01541 [Metarhizium album ARSEF 1941]|uniref:Uncharacterized protein n=1 Tax=Metarhizium album (strain ARSEF 1941) TaxID=1081103 RepID=A0A0B2X4W8_METAS|nr:uncharacterized protein MAM_01541 [Metarhizium album ARSEF 1941]KHO00763.1 hypothetical protein MAM_01541 [Metarhizium album ARSEF 1941]